MLIKISIVWNDLGEAENIATKTQLLIMRIFVSIFLFRRDTAGNYDGLRCAGYEERWSLVRFSAVSRKSQSSSWIVYEQHDTVRIKQNCFYSEKKKPVRFSNVPSETKLLWLYRSNNHVTSMDTEKTIIACDKITTFTSLNTRKDT